MSEPISSVAKKVVDECQFGVPMEDALQRMADRIRSYDLGLVVIAVVIQSQVGGSLAQVLDSIAETIKEEDPDPGRGCIADRRGTPLGHSVDRSHAAPGGDRYRNGDIPAVDAKGHACPRLRIHGLLCAREVARPGNCPPEERDPARAAERDRPFECQHRGRPRLRRRDLEDRGQDAWAAFGRAPQSPAGDDDGQGEGRCPAGLRSQMRCPRDRRVRGRGLPGRGTGGEHDP